MDDAARVGAILRGDALRWRLLGLVASLALPDCWIGAGFVREAVWNHLHGRPPTPPAGDIDVVWFDPARVDPAEDRTLEAVLRGLDPARAWSVKNQARMHARNGDAPYASATDAMRFWPETATAVAARRVRAAGCEIAAPLGLDDLFALVVGPTPRFEGAKRPEFADRLRTKRWAETWPLLRIRP